MIKRPGALTLLLPLALMTLALAFVASACGDDEEESDASAVLAAVDVLDSAGLHAIDDSISRDGKVPATAHTTAVHLQTVMLVTAWPKELDEQAKSLAALLADFATTIDTDTPDMKKAAEAANKVHTASHDFSNLAWQHLGKQAGIAPHEHAVETTVSPAATSPTATPMPKLQVVDATVRATTTDVTAAYFTVKNPGPADRLLKVSVDPSIAKMVQLHTVVTEGGTSMMKEVPAIDVPANGEVVLKPGGFHVMMMNVQKPLAEGESVVLTLTFEKAGTVQVTAAVKTMVTGGGMSQR